MEELIGLPDKVYETQFVRELDEGLTLVRESCPIGVIGVIFEARPCTGADREPVHQERQLCDLKGR